MEVMSPNQGWYARDARAWTCQPPDDAAAAFHRRLPGYAPTPLVEAPELAAELGAGRLFVKDESARFDLRAFKYLGASWAGFRVVSARTGYTGPADLAGLAAHAAAAGTSITLVTATDGNHGRAVARTAKLLGLPARVYVPRVTVGLVIDRITTEGASVTVVDGDYDESVAAAQADAGASADAVLVQDTAWDGYTEIPSWIVEGYETLFGEIDAQLAAAGAIAGADIVSVPTGVGSLAQAAVAHFRSSAALSRPRLLSVEPDTAACVLASLSEGSVVSVRTASTVMNGLNCGTPSALAWPYLRDGLDAAIAVSDIDADAAMASLQRSGVAAGPSGAASLAGLRAALTGPGANSRRRDLGLDDFSGRSAPGRDPVIAVCLCTEGPFTVED
jgi:diaminopropionate ammonia-lyase